MKKYQFKFRKTNRTESNEADNTSINCIVYADTKEEALVKFIQLFKDAPDLIDTYNIMEKK